MKARMSFWAARVSDSRPLLREGRASIGVGCSVVIDGAPARETKTALKENAIGLRFSGRA